MSWHVPYFALPVVNIGPVPIDPWATLCCVAFVVGMEIARARGLKRGLDVRSVVDGSVFIVAMGFIVGHLVAVLAYHPEQLEQDGVVALLKLWAGFSSFGGFLGAVLGTVLFYRWVYPKYYKNPTVRPFWEHADLIMFGFPFAWIFGRLACGVVHDHIGRPTDFFLAMDFGQAENPAWAQLGVRHELGLYEAYIAVGISILWLILDRKPRKAGFFTAVWCAVYAPCRFGLDFLRATDLPSSDVRWSGLTPAQWGCFVLVGCAIGLTLWLRKQPAPEASSA